MSITSEKVKQLIEQRKLEAIRKQVSQKLILVARVLGKPVVATSVADRLTDTWERDGDLYVHGTEVLTVEPDDEWEEHEVGHYFDGLRCGINLCVSCVAYDGHVTEVRATYNGYVVYAEVEGDLKSYAPSPSWEGHLDMFHEGAVAKDKKEAIERHAEKIVERKTRLAEFWKAFQNLWGY